MPNIGSSRSKLNLSIFFILLNAFLWYYLTLNIISHTSSIFHIEILQLLSSHSVGVIIGGMTGLLLTKHRYRLLLLWTFLGTATSLQPALTSVSTLPYFQLICFAWGFSFGLGMPSCLGYFAENIPIENRGRFGGLVLLVSFSCAIPIAGFAQSFGLNFLYFVFGLWRLLGFIPLFILHFEKEKSELKKEVKESIMSIMHDRRLFLYLVPWIMFNIIDKLEDLLLRGFVNTSFPQYYVLTQLVTLFSLSIFAFLGGLLCDLIGRKPMTILGFSSIGIAYALISMIPNSWPAWFFFFVIDGFAWGLLLTIFITLIWGDLSPRRLAEVYYYIGNIPFFLANIIQWIFASYMTFLNETSAFSLAAFFLFVAVLPILFAPETLPEKKIRERELRQYIEKAKKIKEKHS